MYIHNIKIHNKQQTACQYPCCRTCKTNSRITSHFTSNHSHYSTSDQLCNTCHHRKQSIAQALNSISIDINHSKRNKKRSQYISDKYLQTHDHLHILRNKQIGHEFSDSHNKRCSYNGIYYTNDRTCFETFPDSFHRASSPYSVLHMLPSSFPLQP